jgi:hypothetical protein
MTNLTKLPTWAGKERPLFQASRLEGGVGVRQPDFVILLETRENPADGGRPVGRPDHRTLNLPHKGRQVLGANLNYSESRRGAADPFLYR